MVNRYVRPDGLGDYTKIQPCIDAALEGNTCWVYPGTYRENIRFHGKKIFVASARGPESTIIDGGWSGPTVQFVDYETRNTVLAGFTIVNGKASYPESAELESGQEHGGGIRILAASPVIQNCIVLDNTAEGNGGGVYCAFTGSQPKFDHLMFYNNTAVGQGGGLYLFSGTIELNSCLFIDNRAGSGGGISAEFGAHVSLNNSTLADNAATEGNGAEAFTLFNSSATLVDSILGHQPWEETPAVPQLVLDLDLQQPSPGIPPAISLTMDHVDLEGGAEGIVYQGDCELSPELCLPDVRDPVQGDPRFVPFVEPGDNPLQEYYLSQINGGQSLDSPCLDAGSTSAEAAGLNASTTQNGENGHQLPDEGTVDLGYHYTILLP